MNKHTSHIMQFFTHSQPFDQLKALSKTFLELAEWLDQSLPNNPEKTVALRKLLEAQDAAIRAKLAKDQ